MLLKYYGVDKSPAGDPTNPETLNSWLKQNNGYAFGALKWNSIAAYSVKANQIFSTQQKIKFSGYGAGNDFSTLDNELASSQPTILQEPGHFIVASKKQGSDYSIADPAWENKTTLAAYSDSFNSMRRFEKTNTDLSAIYISSPAPSDILITDSLGRKTGKDSQTGEVFNQIPNSYYVLEPALKDQSSEDTPTPDQNTGINMLVIINPQQDTYDVKTSSENPNYPIDFSAYDQDGNVSVEELDSQSQSGSYQLSYSPQTGSELEVAKEVEIDIRPGGPFNIINPKSKGPLMVGIKTTDGFDVKDIDRSTLKFGPAQTSQIGKTFLVDIDFDKDKDLLVFFRTDQARLTPEDKQACLIGKTLDGESFYGCDEVRILNLPFRS